MFEKLSLLWKGDASLSTQYSQFVEMLEKDYELYKVILKQVRDSGDLKAISENVYRGDIQVNKLERLIRKELITHLSLNSGQDVPGSLVLMSVVKDAERIGDLCKNLYETAVFWGQPINTLKFAAKINEFEIYVSETFSSTIKAFETEDDSLAVEIMQDEVKWNKRFDAFIEELADSDVSTREAVVSTLFCRTLKRVQAHLSNIASSVVLPVHRIDHRPKNLRNGAKKD